MLDALYLSAVERATVDLQSAITDVRSPDP